MQRLTNYKGVDIFVRDSGAFYVSDEDGGFSATTIAELKKQIDSMKKKLVDQDALVLGGRYSDDDAKLLKGRVRNIIDTGRQFGSKECWITYSDGQREKRSATQTYPATPTNKTLAARWVELMKQIKQLEKKAEEVKGSMVSFDPDLRKRQQGGS